MAVVNNKSGMPKFEPVEVSFQSRITAVCAGDDENEDCFYVGDEEGNVFVLNNEGEVIASRKMPEETAGAIVMIMNIKLDSRDGTFLTLSLQAVFSNIFSQF